MSYTKCVHEGIYNVVSYRGDLYGPPTNYIKGWHRFCSGGIVSGIEGRHRYAKPGRREVRELMDLRLLDQMADTDWLPVISLYRYRDHYWDGATYFDLPFEYAATFVLDRIYRKANEGVGGSDMWGHNKYRAKTFVMADRIRGSGEMCIANFGKWLMTRPDLVNIHRHGPVEGAHGGKCTSYLLDVKEAEYREWRKEVLQRLQAHVDYLHEYHDKVLAWRKKNKKALSEKYVDRLTKNLNEQW